MTSDTATVNPTTIGSRSYFAEPWDALRFESEQGFHAPRGQQQSEQAADDAENEAFGEKLANQTSSPCAKRGAHGNLGLPGRRLREEEIGDVDAGDQQHEPDRAEKHQHCLANVSDHRFVQLHSGEVEAFIAVRILSREPRTNGLDLCFHLLDRHSGSCPADHCEIPGAALLDGEVIGIFDRCPDLTARREREPLRHHADHLIGHAVERDAPPDDAGFGSEPLAPQ